jgi:Mn2+/Fe2+ NRAMP family transporter
VRDGTFRWGNSGTLGVRNMIRCNSLSIALVQNIRQVKTDIETSSQAAEALKPIAGDFAFAIFVLGIVGTGLLAIPVLAGSAAYALAEARRWKIGLTRKPHSAIMGTYSEQYGLASCLGAS